jgi:transposase InsO family protein
MALEKRDVRCRLVHHSDRGVQYASGEYTDLLKEQGIAISMNRTGNPYDNAMAESFMKTLKYEEVYLYYYADLHEAEDRLGRYFDFYNHERRHQGLGGTTPYGAYAGQAS